MAIEGDFTPPSATVAANGVAEVTWKTSGRQTWIQDQITTSAPGVGGGAQCEILKNGNRISLMIATGDTADGPPPVTAGPNDTMKVRWTGALPGAVASVTWVHYTLGGT